LPLLTAMDVDILLAYLALGSPVGVYLFFQADKGGLNLLTASKTILGFVLWPVFLCLLIYQRKSVFSDTSNFETRNKSDSRITRAANLLRSSIEKSIGDLQDRRFAIRKELFDAIDRFVGLRLASFERMTAQAANAEIYTVAGHPNPHLATVCLARRNSERIVMHAARSEADLRETIGRLAPMVAAAPEFIELVSDSYIPEPQEATRFHAEVITSRRPYESDNAAR